MQLKPDILNVMLQENEVIIGHAQTYSRLVTTHQIIF